MGFHAFFGCDSVGRFAKKGKATLFSFFKEADEDVLLAVENCCETLEMLSKFVCKIYSPVGIPITSLKKLRWTLFCKSMGASENLPPTDAALEQHLMRANFQAYIWHQCDIPNQIQLDPTEHGWKLLAGKSLTYHQKSKSCP